VGNLWSLATIIGPILLAAAILWALMRNRRQRPEEIARSERAVHDNYERTDREDHEREHRH
jgi:ABC-type nickel/cobalt efflux system permease component RcnA